MNKTHRISIGLSDQEYADLQQISENHRVSLAWIGRQAISDFLAAYGKENHSKLLPFREAQKGK